MKTNKFKTLLLSIMIISALSIAACGKTSNTKESSHISKINLDNLLKYNNSYVGDNSSISNIIYNLPGNEYAEGFQLQTDNIPYEININYRNFKATDIKLDDGTSISDSLSEIFKKNAAVIFSLVKNADIINFNVDDNIVCSYKRNELSTAYKDEYGEDLENISESSLSLTDFFKKDIKE